MKRHSTGEPVVQPMARFLQINFALPGSDLSGHFFNDIFFDIKIADFLNPDTV